MPKSIEEIRTEWNAVKQFRDPERNQALIAEAESIGTAESEAWVSLMKAHFERDFGDKKKALASFEEALHQFEKTSDQNGLAASYNGIGLSKEGQGSLDESL